MSLLGPDGKPVITYRKEKPKAIGPSFGARWGGEDLQYAQLPGGSILQFDLSLLTLSDFRAMRYNPQINASLSVLTFMVHQVDWHIVSDDKKIATAVEDMLRPLWTRLIRGISQAFWAGFSPMALEYENNVITGRTEISKIKDLVPEDCRVNWKEVVGNYNPPGNTVPPKFNLYDGIKQYGSNFAIPPENTLWYPLLMENGNYYGRQLLKAAFMPWYFSTLMHLFSNRYFERFGEPVPIGRAPLDEEIVLEDGTTVPAKQAMTDMLNGIRSRSVVVMPSDRQQVGSSGANEYMWDIEYLESQMRGADFERYMTRLDEEMSLALFTPLLLLRNADVGSHNLGVQHTQTWLWMLNAIIGDMKEYIDRYIVRRLVEYNHPAGKNAPRVEWRPQKLGKEQSDTTRAIITTLINAGKAKVDVVELGEALGMTVEEVNSTRQDIGTGKLLDPLQPKKPDLRVRDNVDTTVSGSKLRLSTHSIGEARATGRSISGRIRPQIEKAWRENRFGPELTLSFGYTKRFAQSLVTEGWDPDEAREITGEFYDGLESAIEEIINLGQDEFSGPSDVMALIDRLIDSGIDSIATE